jgi:NADH-quinone oxidoreductase subunit F
MEKLNSVRHFEALQGRLLGDRDLNAPTVVVPAGTCGRASGANELIRAAQDALSAGASSGSTRLRVTGCHGFCQMEPSVLVEPGRFFYPRVQPKDMTRIIEAAAGGEPAEDLLFADPESGRQVPRQDDLPFYSKQVRTILSRNERIDPTRIETYIQDGGYSGVAKVLEVGDPLRVVSAVKASGLRGRGGAGFPTGLKWDLLAKHRNGRGKFLVCNADEGDPGAYMDRSVLEGNPHSIIEGMLIGGYGTGATEGIIYVRNEYPLAIKHLIAALEQAHELGLLGENGLGTGFSFDIQLVKGAGAFVCGEETALIRSIEGKMGEPRQRPPFPIERGIDGKPTAINNVETWANIPVIIERGAEAFAEIGTENNSGTKIFSLVGKITNTGLVEVPMGITIGEVTGEIGGGPSDKTRIKAVQTGGPSGGCIPADRFDLPIDYDSLTEAGSIMGSGGMIVMDEGTCMVDVARYFMNFLKDESCGKCFTCRKGTQRMHEILDDISRGDGEPEHLELLDELARVVKDTTMCGLGQTAPNPVLSTLRYFRDEYLEHIESKRCPAGVCKALVTFSINESCTGCRACVKACPEDAITGEKKQRHTIDAGKCIKCGACRSVCKFDAVDVT